MSVYALAFAVLYLGITKLHGTHGESISKGKDAKQSSNYEEHRASHVLDIAYSSRGTLTGLGKQLWWEVDLKGYFTISSITLTAKIFSTHVSYMDNVDVQVMDKDVSLCSDVQVVVCGTVPSTVADGEKFTFTCNANFPVRFVRVTRRSTVDTYLGIGHVDVQGERTMKQCRSNYKRFKNKKVSQSFLTTSAVTAGDCGIVCRRHHSCIYFSFSATAPTDENCLLTDKAVSSHYVYDNSWSTYTIDCM